MKTIEISIIAAASILDFVDGNIPATSPFYLEAICEIRRAMRRLQECQNDDDEGKQHDR